jgi:hypothetical protein
MGRDAHLIKLHAFDGAGGSTGPDSDPPYEKGDKVSYYGGECYYVDRNNQVQVSGVMGSANDMFQNTALISGYRTYSGKWWSGRVY